MNNEMLDWVKSLSAQELIEFVKLSRGRLSTPIHGEEKETVLTMLRLMTPDSTSNNQRSITDVYFCDNVEYHVTYWDDEVTLEEMTDV